jgi:ribonuclease HI
MKSTTNDSDAVVRIFTDGAGCRPDGTGSGFCWLREDTGRRKITREDGLTNNQAEYRAISSAIEFMDSDSAAEILSDSENTCCQLRGERRVRDPRLAELKCQIEAAIENRKLTVQFTWIPRRDNKAGKLI